MIRQIEGVIGNGSLVMGSFELNIRGCQRLRVHKDAAKLDCKHYQTSTFRISEFSSEGCLRKS